MPRVQANIEFLARDDKYKTEKPYVILLGEDEDSDDEIPVTNLHFELIPSIDVWDMREHAELDLESCGFEFIAHHQSNVVSFGTSADIAAYVSETNDLLMNRFQAVHVLTYEVKLRQNILFERQVYDVDDPLAVEGPAVGAHNDVTTNSARNLIKKHLTEDQKALYLARDLGYRLRIINTWRPLNSVCEDRPLALCDSRTVRLDDLEVTTRVLPDREVEIYYLHHSTEQQWYWLEKQRSTEPFIFLMFDTMAGKDKARLCPHVSFNNPRKSPESAPRSSVETRSIVITLAKS